MEKNVSYINPTLAKERTIQQRIHSTPSQFLSHGHKLLRHYSWTTHQSCPPKSLKPGLRGCDAWFKCCLLIAREVNDVHLQISVMLWKVKSHSISQKHPDESATSQLWGTAPTFRSYFLWTTSLWLNMFLMTIRYVSSLSTVTRYMPRNWGRSVLPWHFTICCETQHKTQRITFRELHP